METIPFLW